MKILAFGFWLFAGMALAQEQLRVATYNVGFGRDGPGLLLKDIQDQDDDIRAVAQIIATISPDILLLTNFDHDYRNVALTAFRDLILAETGQEYAYIFATGGNAGVPSGLDLNGNGQLGDWRDNWGFGRFEGNESMALLSKFPIDTDNIRSFDHFLWRDLPNAIAPQNPDESAFLTADIWAQIRLSTQSHWDLAVELPSGKDFHLLATHATPPVFDGDENLNGLRNDAEIGFWVEYLSGTALPDDSGDLDIFTAHNFVLFGDLNADPYDGESLRHSLQALLIHPKLRDVQPQSAGGTAATALQMGENARHSGDPRYDTADWADADLGNLRVDYVLPSSSLTVLDFGIFWPLPDHPDFPLLEAAKTAHRMVWVDIALP